MKLRYLTIALGLTLGAALTLFGQAPPTGSTTTVKPALPPVLSENLNLKLENLNLKMQMVQAQERQLQEQYLVWLSQVEAAYPGLTWDINRGVLVTKEKSVLTPPTAGKR